MFYWRERNREVDFVVRAGRSVVAIEVKSGRRPRALPGLEAFAEAHDRTRTLLVGGDGIELEGFLRQPAFTGSDRDETRSSGSRLLDRGPG